MGESLSCSKRNTTITVGNFKNVHTDDYSIVDGDYPLTIISPNTVIQCGVDGKRSNNCTLDVGFAHVLIEHYYAYPSGNAYIEIDNIDNSTIRGMTFTGSIQDPQPIMGTSVSMGVPTTGLTFDNCLWMQVSSFGLVMVTTNQFQNSYGYFLPSQSARVVITDSFIEDIVYDGPIFYVADQILEYRDTRVHNVTKTAFPARGCAFGSDIDTLEEGCANLMLCHQQASCLFSNVCVTDMVRTENLPALLVSNSSSWSSDSSLLDDETCDDM